MRSKSGMRSALGMALDPAFDICELTVRSHISQLIQGLMIWQGVFQKDKFRGRRDERPVLLSHSRPFKVGHLQNGDRKFE